MNTGKQLETTRLYLKPANNERDIIPFLSMLRDDGDFTLYASCEYSECIFQHRFSNYFKRYDRYSLLKIIMTRYNFSFSE